MINVGDYMQIKVNGSAFNQAVNNVFDYRASGAANEGNIFLDIFRQEWRRWIVYLLSNKYQVHSYSLQVYDRLEYVPPTGPDAAKLKIWWADKAKLEGDANDVGKQNANPLPSTIAISARKTVTGAATAFRGRGTAILVGADTRMKGSCRLGPLTEDQTRDDNGNELADTFLASINPLAIGNPFAANRANWLSGWRYALEQMRHITTQSFGFGTSSTMEMQVVSLRGPDNTIRRVDVSGTMTPQILFSTVSAFGCSRYVGKQGSRQQREKFQ